MQQLSKIIDSIWYSRITENTYQLAREICKDIDPNDRKKHSCQRNVLDALCFYTDFNDDVKFAKFWLSLDFKVPIELDDFIITNTFSGIFGELMLEALMRSEPGKRFINQNETIKSSKLLDIFARVRSDSYRHYNAFNVCKTFQIACCFMRIQIPLPPIEEQTQNCDEVYEDFRIDPAKYCFRMRLKHGYAHVDSTRVFCFTLLIRNKFLQIVY